MTKNYLPWAELIQAFMTTFPERMQSAGEIFNHNPLTELREMRVLTLGGARQTGKTGAALEVVRQRDDARFMINSGFRVPPILKVDPLLRSRSVEKIGLTKEMFDGVNVIVIDNDGMPENDLAPYKIIESHFALHNDWFEPGFMVIRIL